MRLDQLLATLALIKRRTEAKRMADNGLISVNHQTAKPSHAVKPGDIIAIGGSKPLTVEIISIPSGSVRKDQRTEYYKQL